MTGRRPGPLLAVVITAVLCAGCSLSSESTVNPTGLGPATTVPAPAVPAGGATVPPVPTTGLPRHTGPVVVGSYVGQPVASVRGLLATQHDLVPRYVPYPVASAALQGTVVAQDPPADSTVAAGTVLTLDVGSPAG